MAPVTIATLYVVETRTGTVSLALRLSVSSARISNDQAYQNPPIYVIHVATPIHVTGSIMVDCNFCSCFFSGIFLTKRVAW